MQLLAAKISWYQVLAAKIMHKKEGKTERTWRKKTTSIWRWDDYPYRKAQRLHKRRHLRNKWIQPGFRKKKNSTEKDNTVLYTNTANRNAHNTIYNYPKVNKILRYTLDKTCPGSVCWQSQWHWKKSKKTLTKWRHTVFTDCMTQHSKAANSPHTDL